MLFVLEIEFMLKLKYYKKNIIVGLYHIGFIGKWEEIYNDHFEKIKKSGLMDITEKIFLGTSGKKTLINLPPKTEWATHNDRLDQGENKTLLKIHEICQNIEPCKIWYMHTKGASWDISSKRTRFNEKNIKLISHNVDLWRSYLDYFSISKHKDCIESLEKFDICGVSWNESLRFFNGNFWWATSKHIKKINKTDVLKTGLRGRGELFIGSIPCKVKDFFPINKDFYKYPINPAEYKSQFKI